MATFSKQGYIKIAAVLKDELRIVAGMMAVGNALGTSTIEEITKRLADLFAQDSLAFDRQRFYKAVGIAIPMEEAEHADTLYRDA